MINIKAMIFPGEENWRVRIQDSVNWVRVKVPVKVRPIVRKRDLPDFSARKLLVWRARRPWPSFKRCSVSTWPAMQGLNHTSCGFLGFAEKNPRGPYIVGQCLYVYEQYERSTHCMDHTRAARVWSTWSTYCTHSHILIMISMICPNIKNLRQKWRYGPSIRAMRMDNKQKPFNNTFNTDSDYWYSRYSAGKVV